ncbi:MAG: sigma-70 family RNA polymerase sigma factor [Actinomycetota bacterium]|nr:sigma-70 family RNA polymerase sigma factor [Actinomycetota bacterium]
MGSGSATALAVDSPEARTAALISRHGLSLLRVARKFSLCHDDAQDAYQRALEIYLRRFESLEPAAEAAWMRVVVRNEALAVRRARLQSVNGEEVDFDAQQDSNQRSIEERTESAERVSRSAEALRHLKHDEARALMLKAEGLSYKEIADQLGWSYTKVNRAITEGRARFRRVYQGIESGEQCEQFAPALLALAQGEADAGHLTQLRPHLRHCGACRADVRRLHRSPWQKAAAFFPLPAFAERLRPGNLKAEFYGLFSRWSAADPASTSLLASGGSGRGVGASAMVGLCLAGAGAGGYCVVNAPLKEKDASAAVRSQREPAARVALRPHRVEPTATVAVPVPARVAAAPGAADKPGRSGSKSRQDARPSRRERRIARTPQAPASLRVSTAKPQSGSEFSFEDAEAPAAAPQAPARASAQTTSPAVVPVAAPAPTPAPSAAPPPERATAPAPANSSGEFGFED